MRPPHDPRAAVKTGVYRYDSGRLFPEEVSIIRERSLEVVLNDRPQVTIACLGLHTEELALGWLRSEGLLAGRDDVLGIETSGDGTAVHVRTRSQATVDGQSGLSIASSGARGRNPAAAPTAATTAMRHEKALFAPATVLKLMDEMTAQGWLHSSTGGTHCAALADAGGIRVLREDIGRHNCLDMLIGHCLLEGLDASDKLLLRTGRVSLEIVRKVQVLGTGWVASLSVPTAAAMELAEQSGICLMGAVRNGRMTLYTNAQRMGVL